MKTKFTHLILIFTFFCSTVSADIQTVMVGDFFFSPANFTIDVGDTVTWVWVSGGHTTTSTSVPAGAATWNSPITVANQTFSYKVTTAGLYNYVCTPHAPGMGGQFTALTPAGVNEASSVITLNVYPNPCSDYLTISGNVDEVQIFNSIGKLVSDFSAEKLLTVKNVIPVSTLSKGIYLVAVTNKNERKVFKVNKN